MILQKFSIYYNLLYVKMWSVILMPKKKKKKKNCVRNIVI